MQQEKKASISGDAQTDSYAPQKCCRIVSHVGWWQNGGGIEEIISDLKG